MNLNENIDRIKQIMTEDKVSYVSRDYLDQKYEDEYPKWQKSIIKILESEIDSYTEINDGNIIVLFNNKNNFEVLMKYNKLNERLVYDFSIKEALEDYIPYGYISRHFKYAVQDFFKKHFPQYGVREIMVASIR